MLDFLEGFMSRLSDEDYGEIRYHDRTIRQVAIRQGELEEASSSRYSGCAIRILKSGAWGFSSTSRMTKESICQAIEDARKAAECSSTGKKEGIRMGEANLARGAFAPPVDDPLENHSLEEKLELVRRTEEQARNASSLIVSAASRYVEMLDHKVILTSDGARADLRDSKPEFRVFVVAEDHGETVEAFESEGATGGYGDLFRNRSAEQMMQTAVERAAALLKAGCPEGERATVILDPSLVGLISHEAIGHTVEADFVLAGAITKGKLGEQVASPLVTLVDCGPGEIGPSAGGMLLVDDEGVITERTIVIENGVLRSYLHNRETAAIFEVPSTGSARAFEYTDEPIIRMRNTYIEPRDATLEEMIQGVKEGYLLKGSKGGQADANAEFMFGVQEAIRIKEGKLGERLRGVTISGQAFDVLGSVDAVGSEFEWALGAGYCGKMQAAKVDAGGPHLRCKAIVGGRQ